VVSGEYFAEELRAMRPSKARPETYTRFSDDGRGVVRCSFKTGEVVETLFQSDSVRFGGYVLSPDEQKMLIETHRRSIYRHSFTAEYYVWDVQRRTLTPLSTNGPQQVVEFSPDGERVAFVRANNLFLVDLGTGSERQITHDGERNAILNGIPDWVNEEEFSTDRNLAFSADGSALAWVRYDERAVPIYSFPIYKGLAPAHAEADEYPSEYAYKYPVAGAQNASVSAWAYDIASGQTRQINVPLDAEDYIPRLLATADAKKFAVCTLNRHQDCMDIYLCDPADGSAQRILREQTDKYLSESAYGDLRFYKDGFVLTSERTGHAHLYLYGLDGTLKRALTQGDYDVRTFYDYLPASGRTLFAATDGGPLRTAVFSTDKKGRLSRLTPEQGTAGALFSTDGQYFVKTFSNLTTPPVFSVCDAKGQTLQTLKDNAQLKAKMQPWAGTKEFFSFKTKDGVELNGWMIKPRDFDASKQHPVVMYQYSGPGSQEVRDRWQTGFYPGGLFENVLCDAGFICACVDGRGTGGRGSEWERQTYLTLGQKEAADQVEAALYLGSLPYVDAERIGIWGWSFGGFCTLMAMSEGRPAFKAGVAVAAVANWKFYDSIYTERYMRTPQENAEGYADNPISRAANLHGDLLIMHGTADDNVHYRNCAEVCEAYVQAGKPFDMHIFTNRNHSIYGGKTRTYLLTRIVDFFKEKLLQK